MEAAEHHERLKRLEYEERIINVEHGSFCPLVFSTPGAPGHLATRFLKPLAGKIAEKDNEEYSAVMAWIRCKLSFALLRSAVMCVRGSRSSRHSPVLVDCRRMLADWRPLRPELSNLSNGPQNYWIDQIVDQLSVVLTNCANLACIFVRNGVFCLFSFPHCVSASLVPTCRMIRFPFVFSLYHQFCPSSVCLILFFVNVLR